MEFSQEVYSLIVRHVNTHSDLLSLCTVSKPFQKEAERALYNTLHLRGYTHSISVCELISSTPRLSSLVEALSLFVVVDDPDHDDDESYDERSSPSSSFTKQYWDVVAAALRQTVRLRFLSVYFEQVNDTSHAEVLAGCTFQLRTFHCDFEWDDHLASFLASQNALSDLYLADYRVRNNPVDSPSPLLSAALPPLPKLSILECTFSEAAVAFVPGRPVIRLKTCFSRTKIEEKHVELQELLAALKCSKKSLRSLDLADESYDPAFTLDILTSMASTFANSNLRYLGTLVFPVDGRQRLEFYTRLMRLPRLQCVELEVSEWDPSPMTPAALRALTYELRIYCPSITRVIFVYEFDRIVMKLVDNVCALDNDAATDTLWREI